MRKIRETLRLHFDNRLGQRPIARCLDIFRTTIGDYLRRAEAAGLSWPLPDFLTDQQLSQQLFPPAVPVAPSDHLTRRNRIGCVSSCNFWQAAMEVAGI